MEEENMETEPFKDCTCHEEREKQVRSILNHVAEAKLNDARDDEFMAERERALRILMEMIH